MDEEEQRIIYQRKLLLLSTRKVREKEIETIIRMKNASQRGSVERSERDLDAMLRAIEKQVRFFVVLLRKKFSTVPRDAFLGKPEMKKLVITMMGGKRRKLRRL